MFCCCSLSMPEDKERKPVIVDLREILRDKAWNMWHSSFNCLQRMRWKRSLFEIEVPENYYIFEDVTETRDQEELLASNNNSGRQGMNFETKKGKDGDTVTIETKFNNDTGEKQTYKFRFEKNRRTEVTVSFQKGFTFGANTNFKVGLPQILGGETGAEVGASMEYQVTSSKGQTFEESVIMEATSDIVVSERSCYVADVQLHDVHIMKPFRSRTRLRIPQGYAPIYIKRKKDGLQVSVYTVRNLKDIFGHCACVKTSTTKEGEASTDGTAAPEYDGSWIDLITEGYVEGTFACNHQILLRKLDGAGK